MPNVYDSVFLELHAIGTLHLSLLSANVVPVGGQNCAIALLERFVHGAFGFFASIAVDLLEELIQSRISFGFFVLLFLDYLSKGKTMVFEIGRNKTL